MNSFWLGHTTRLSKSPKKLWIMLDRLLRKNNNSTISELNADAFSNFFIDKVSGIRSSTGGSGLVIYNLVSVDRFSTFSAVMVDELRSVILGSPVTSCSLDPVPTCFLTGVLDDLLPFILLWVNASFAIGTFP